MDDRRTQQQDLDDHDVTGEVASQGGSPGDVEIHEDDAPATGREADETWRPTERRQTPVARDETGQGRRSA